MLVKICGLKNELDALGAVDAGADFIGFVFAESKRQVTVQQAHLMKENLPTKIKTVGVFVDTPIEEINQIAQLVQLDYVQLHGNETVLDCKRSQYPVIKALTIDSEQALAKAEKYLPFVEYLLIDGPKPGSGQTFDWNQLNTMRLPREKIILAGGLSIDNVQTAIKMVNPVGVDVSSGVETDGEKDIVKIQQFISEAKGVR